MLRPVHVRHVSTGTIVKQRGEEMKKKYFLALSFVMGICLLGQPVTASDCSGPWNVLPNRTPGMTPCEQLGLDTKRGVCQPGQAYETLCDDSKGNRYRICQGPRPCSKNVAPAAPPVQVAPPCTTWDYTNNKPCPPGYLNHDCRGGCGPVR